MKIQITDINARQILDSRGIPTIETKVTLNSGISGSAAVPSGASTGKFEAVELRDNDKNNFFGKSVYKAINNVEKNIKPFLIGHCPFNQKEIDLIMLEKDGTKNKSKFGANAILSVSLACARAAANELEIPLYKYLGGLYASMLPIPMVNILNGGAHANNKLDFQEFMIQPVSGCNMHESIKMAAEVFHELKRVLNNSGCSIAVGDEGGFAPNFKSNREALEALVLAINNAGYTTDEIKICIDAAASELYSDGKYILKGEQKELSSIEMISYLEDLTEKYPIISIEDGLDQEDFIGWKTLTAKLSSKCQLVGDDLFVTNYNRLENGINEKLANAILIKPNQTGTLSETMDTILLAQKNNYKTVISHRSGETTDTFIADLSVAVNAGQIKTGSMSRGERTSKYNRLMEIENDITGV
ncbi:MAG: phosphopyruvate hydratase [Candidatus Gastranaerophilales bacterium]|nr:phosphopyruvate hydratase [Candidatus Gastranaerophilales bacterium]